ncbi:hypothetical protein D3C80_768910 [compost metagenome]
MSNNEKLIDVLEKTIAMISVTLEHAAPHDYVGAYTYNKNEKQLDELCEALDEFKRGIGL